MGTFFWELMVVVGGVLGATVGFLILALVFILLALPFWLMYRRTPENSERERLEGGVRETRSTP